MKLFYCTMVTLSKNFGKKSLKKMTRLGRLSKVGELKVVNNPTFF